MAVKGTVYGLKKNESLYKGNQDQESPIISLIGKLNDFSSEVAEELRSQGIEYILTTQLSEEDYLNLISSGFCVIEVENSEVAPKGSELTIDYEKGLLINHTTEIISKFRTEQRRMKEMAQFVHACKGKVEYQDYINCVAKYQYESNEVRAM